MSTPVTIDTIRNELVAREEDGTVIARQSSYCNPAALHQIILAVEMAGRTIDWAASQVAPPADRSARV